MDPTIASYFRAILFRDPKSPNPIPESLVKLYKWTQKAHLSMQLGSAIPKPLAISIVLTWLSTPDGSLFANDTEIADLFPIEEHEQVKKAKEPASG